MASSDIRFDAQEIMVRGTKYIVEGFIVSVAAFFIPGNHKLSVQDIVLLGLIASATFALLDLFAPSIGASVRQGAGFSLGAGVVGGVPTTAGRFG